LRLRLTFGLCALVLALALAACGGGGGEKTTPSGGQQQATATVQKTVAAGEKPSGGEASLKDIPVYPGAKKVADYSGTSPIPLPGGEGADTAEYQNIKWALYETGDSAGKVGDFYKGKMPDNGWHEEGWFDTSSEEGGVALGSYTRDDGNVAAWVFVSGSGDKTEIVMGTGSR
jgi:hypothetical protein